MSWTRKILRVNLTHGTVGEEALNMDWANEYLGQRGLATRYLVDEIDPQCDALGPDNKLIMTTGPLTGTIASTGGRYSVVCKSPLTNAVACSNSGGFFGAELKFAGWDMVDDLWGQSVWAADHALRQTHTDPQVRIACIGRSAEAGNLYAAIVNDLHRAAGRSGVGTVMASKNLKAVVCRGTQGLGGIEDPQRFMQTVKDGKKVLAENAVTGQGLPAYGTQVLMNVINEVGALPTRNMSETQFEGANNVGGEAMHEPRKSDGKPNLTTNGACFSCTIACGRISTIDRTHFSVKDKPEYWINSGGLEYEAAWALGPDTGVDDIDALTYVNFLCNEDGMDPISLGSTIAAAMELFETGVITTEHTGGMELKFGAEVAATGEGFGADIGLGSKRLCEKYGKPELSMTVKGQEFPAYDPRGIQGMGLAYATANRGACHLRGYTVASEILGIPEKTDPLESGGKAGLVKAFQDATAAVDSAGLCVFTTFAWTMDDIAPQVDSACEGDWSTERMMEVGERIWNLEKDFNQKAGVTGADDTLPKRLLTEGANTGPAKGRVSELDQMLPEYYQLRGYSADGSMTDETRQKWSLPS